MPVLEQVLELFSEEVKLVFKNYPLSNHQYSQKAAAAALAAGRQGKFWEFHDQLYENFDKLNDQKIREISMKLGLDMSTFTKDLKDVKLRETVYKDKREGIGIGVKSTPTVFVNGRRLRARTISIWGICPHTQRRCRRL